MKISICNRHNSKSFTRILLVLIVMCASYANSTLAQSVTDGVITATLNSQTPVNTVPSGQPVTYSITLANTGGSEQAGVGMTIRVNGIVQSPDTGPFSSSGCSVDPFFPTEWWACGGYVPDEGETVTFSWTPQDGAYDIQFETFYQLPLDNDGSIEGNLFLDLQTVVGQLAPEITQIADQQVDELAEIFFSVAASDPNVEDSLTFETPPPGLPTFCTFDPTGSGIDFACRPQDGDAGTYTVTITVTDNGIPSLSATDTFVITVGSVSANQAPVLDLIGLNQFVAEGATLVIPLNATDPDPSDTLTYSQTGLPAFCNLTDNGDGTGSITCNPQSGDAGSSNVLVTVTDDGTPPASDSDRFVLTVTSNPAPVLAAIGSQTVVEGETLSIPLNATDPDPNDTLAFSQSGLPAFCSLTDNGDGTGAIVCNPVSGDAGTSSVTVTVTDDGDPPSSDEETFNIVVEGAAAPIVSVIAAGSAGVAISVDDTDGLDGETIQVTGSATDPEDGDLPPDSFRWFVNGEEVTEAAGQATATLTLPNGESTIEFEATDSDENSTRASVTVTVSEPASFVDDGPISGRPGLSPNETETAVGLENTCENILGISNPTQEQLDLLALCSTLASDSSSDADVADTLNAISGEQVTSQQATSVDFASVQLSNVGSRISALRTLGLRGSRGVSTAGLNMDISVDGKPVPVYAVAEVVKGLLRGGGASADGAETDSQSDTSTSTILNPKLGIFINGNIAFGDKDQTTNETGFDFDSTGITVGMDYLFTDHFVAGIALGYANAEAKFFGDTGEQSSDFYSGTLFGTIMHDKWFVAGIGGIANGDYDTIRRISGPLLSQDETASGTTDGNNLFGGLSAEFDFGRGPWRFGPAVAINYIEADIDGFAESGAGALDLVYGDQTATSLTMKAGLRLGYVFTTGFGVLSLDGRGDFVREFENDSQLISVNFVNDPFVNDPTQPSPGFTVLTDEPDEDYGLWGLSLSYQGPHSISGFVDYQSVTGMSGMTLSEITLGLRIQHQFD
jgi:uncharacterized protein with beta-barrel porin domain